MHKPSGVERSTRSIAAHQSIRVRLTTLYAGSICIVLLLGLLGLRTYARGALQIQFEQAVRESARLVHGFYLAELPEYRLVDKTVEHISVELVFPSLGVEFTAPDALRVLRSNFVDRLDLHSKMIDRIGRRGILDQHQLERGIDDGKVRIAGEFLSCC